MSRWLSSFRVKSSVETCTGPHVVGCTDFMCGPEVNSGGANGREQQQRDTKSVGSFVRLFYPSQLCKSGADKTHERVLWLPNRPYADGMINYLKLPAWLLGGFFHWLIGNVRIPAYWNVPVLSCKENAERFPCVVFSHGLGANRLLYSSFCCELASQGCVVAAIEHRDESASATFILRKKQESNELLQEWVPFHVLDENENEFELRNCQLHKRVAECMKAMDILEKIEQGNCPINLFQETIDLQQLKGRLDMDKVAIMGHSFGAATTVSTLAKDNRFKCGICLDVWMLPLGKEFYQYENQQPILFINSQNFHKWKENMEPLKKLVDRNKDKQTLIAIRGTGHMNQSDIPSVLPDVLLSMTKMDSALDQETAVKLNKQAIWAFLKRHLEIGNAPKQEPIIDGGEGIPEHIVFGPSWPSHKSPDHSSL